jgi:6-pyruvoyltetrahydropterin/6-carboxytetrahydropterin synthase
MIRLTRTIRFCVNPPEPGGGGRGLPLAVSNGYGGVPAMRGLGRYYELEVTVAGSPDEATGYLMNIKAIDSATRASAVPIIERACIDRPWVEPAVLIGELWQPLEAALGARGKVRLERLRWRLSPSWSIEMEAFTVARVKLRQRFDFAAAHRLHVGTRSDEENRAIFGKCNNPSGHGHNYQVEPCVSIEVGQAEGGTVTVADLERIVHAEIIEPFDHAHLNVDTAEFDERRGGVNPSVERIAEVFYRRLAPAVARELSRAQARLESMTVWETDRTSATFEGS